MQGQTNQPPQLKPAQYTRLFRAQLHLDALAEELGETWDDYEFDDLSHARSLIREWLGRRGTDA